jgi:hypothetical protein
MDKVQVTLKDGRVIICPADTWGRDLRVEGIKMYEVDSVYSI